MTTVESAAVPPARRPSGRWLAWLRVSVLGRFVHLSSPRCQVRAQSTSLVMWARTWARARASRARTVEEGRSTTVATSAEVSPSHAVRVRISRSSGSRDRMAIRRSRTVVAGSGAGALLYLGRHLPSGVLKRWTVMRGLLRTATSRAWRLQGQTPAVTRRAQSMGVLRPDAVRPVHGASCLAEWLVTSVASTSTISGACAPAP